MLTYGVDYLHISLQLKRQMVAGKAFFGFDDGGALPFPPTFKHERHKSKQASEVQLCYNSKRLVRATTRQHVFARNTAQPNGWTQLCRAHDDDFNSPPTHRDSPTLTARPSRAALIL